MFFFGMRNFRKKARKLKSRLITTTIFFCFVFLNQMKYHLYVLNSVEKCLPSQKLSLFCCNFQWKISIKSKVSKFILNLQKKAYISFFCWVYVGKFSHGVKTCANGILAICHFLHSQKHSFFCCNFQWKISTKSKNSKFNLNMQKKAYISFVLLNLCWQIFA